MSSTTAPDLALARWRDRMTSLGLDPDRDGVDHRILKHTGSLEEYKRWCAFPENAACGSNDVKAEKIATIPEALMRRYVSQHVTNDRLITDPAAVAAIEQRVGRFYLFVQAAPNRDVTGKDPLVINSSGVLTVYNTVTIKEGGFIRITIPCKFECQTLTKVQDGGSSPYDVFVVGLDGTDDGSGNSPSQPTQTAKGSNAQCDCCGGSVAHAAQDGSPGTPGGSGTDAPGNASEGQPGPEVYFYVQAQLNGAISFLNRGGRGGNGGSGGTGSRGGQGGDGGDGRTCGAYQPDGKQGGKGGKGGNGGNGSNGMNGGAGAKLSIFVPNDATTSVLVMNEQAAGGKRGLRGFKGEGGPGGNAGANGGSTGPLGDPGDTDGNDGSPGTQGPKGSTTLNGVPVGG